jgi:hypothetical protein
VRIKNTLHIAEIQVSEPMLPEVLAQPDKFEVLSEPATLAFDGQGDLPPMLRPVEAVAA